MAKAIVGMEKRPDDSMDGFFVNEFVNEYVKCNIPNIIDIFEYVLNNQTQVRSTYGDADYAFTKIKATNYKPIYNNHTYEIVGVLVEDIFSSISFIVIKCFQNHIEMPILSETVYKIYNVPYGKAYRKVDCQKNTFIIYSSLVMEIKKNRIGDFELVNNNMLSKYVRYNDFKFVLNDIYKYLKASIDKEKSI